MRKLTIEEIRKFVKENSNCELLSTEYIDSKTKLSFKCECGNKFKTAFSTFRAQKQRQCPQCGHNSTRKYFAFNYETVKKYIEIDSNSGCKLLSSDYINKEIKLKLRCKCGNVFYKTFGKFKNSGQQQCAKCANIIHWDYDKVKHFVEHESNSGCLLISDKYIDIRTSMTYKCHCGNEFTTSFNCFKDMYQRQCSHCSGSISHGEFKIERYLQYHDIEFISQYRFNDCRNKNPLPFDFYLPTLNTLIEYDGEHHYKVSRYSKNKEEMKQKLQKVQYNDDIKTNYCKQHNIKLLRIPYTKFNNIEKILESTLL